MSTTRKIRCTDCGEAVPHGRLSCPSCGTLLASVAGGVRHAASPMVASVPVGGDPADDGHVAAASTPGPAAASADTTPILRPRLPRPSPARSSAPRPPAQRTAAALTLVPTTVVRSVTRAFTPATAGAFAGGAPGPTTPTTGVPAMAAAAATSGGAGAPGAASAAADPTATASSTGRLAIAWDHERIEAGLEWAAALGAGIVAIAMLLPWSRSVIGSSGLGYFDSWGLAGPGHVFVLAWALVILALAVVPTRVPTWISRGMAALALGVFALGLTWPYAVGPLGGQIGVVLTLIGSIVLVVTGVVADWHTRHDPGEPSV